MEVEHELNLGNFTLWQTRSEWADDQRRDEVDTGRNQMSGFTKAGGEKEG